VITPTITYSALDPEIIDAAFCGDTRAFGAVVERYETPVYNLCRRYVGDAEAEDLAQETFVKAFLHRARFDLSRPLLPWLLTIARRLCIDRTRSKKNRYCDEKELSRLPDESTLADEQLEQKEGVQVLSKLLEALPEGQREAVVLYHVEGLAYKEIAELLAVPMGTVMTWLHRGRNLLQEGMNRMMGEKTQKKAGGDA
jgi:RNA polymerase sigma-70 factor (ECF subfamily)